MALSMAVGALLAVGRLSQRAWLSRPVGAWVELFRGVPLLLLILFVFLGLPAVGVTVSTFWALVGGLTLYNGAVLGEIFRAGILSLPKGQTEAAYAIGLRRGQALRLVLLPQAVRLMLPALVSQLVTLLKDTSLGFVIGYAELLRSGRNAVGFLGGRYSIPIYTAIAVVYIAVNGSLAFLARRLDRRTRHRYGRTVRPSAADEAPEPRHPGGHLLGQGGSHFGEDGRVRAGLPCLRSSARGYSAWRVDPPPALSHPLSANRSEPP
jgi:glutamate transport system permease protein